ncbi:MAG: hypothetical protein J2P37_14795 [Ktedonobacteraceae bacterium]|nr:hypothetical protein [Ktedonobacteraceae bacterium]
MATQPSGGIGSWSAAPSASVGITLVRLVVGQRKPLLSHRRQEFFWRQMVPEKTGERGKKIRQGNGQRFQMSWPRALRAVRSWLEPWILLRRYWRAWSEQPPPGPLQGLVEALAHGQHLFLYSMF